MVTMLDIVHNSSSTWYPSDPTESCVETNSAGIRYEEITCLYPFVGITHLPFEKNYDPVPVRDYMIANPITPIIACLLYGFFIIVGQQYFHRSPDGAKPWNQRTSMALWNLGLSLFSIIGFFRVLPIMVHNWRYYTIRENLCFDPEAHFGSGSTGLWVQLFVLSKFPELLDTYYIVVHKKPLIFLHWYHHVSVLLYCWHSYTTKSPTGIIFCFMNYFVHGIMYFYYFLMAMKLKPKWFRAHYITTIQISQMIVGVAVTILGWYLMLTDNNNPDIKENQQCWMTMDNNMAALIMYGSYLMLFLQFFFKRYNSDDSNQKYPTKKSSSNKPAAVVVAAANGLTNGAAVVAANGDHSSKITTNGVINGSSYTNGHSNDEKKKK